MATDAVELTTTQWVLLTMLTGIISNIGWELFNYFGHAAAHSLASAWHELKRLPSQVLSLHAPFRVAGVVLAALALISLMQAAGGFVFAGALMELVEAYRALTHAIGDRLLALIAEPATRYVVYDVLVVGLILILIIWRTAAGWRFYREFRTAGEGPGDALSFGAYFGLNLLGGLLAVVLALAVLNRLV
jgi:hypothetical protein